jgi:type IV pilus assembly protein PilX
MPSNFELTLLTMPQSPLTAYRNRIHHQGASLIMVMLVLIVVSLLGLGGAQIALMSERSARNDRDLQIAWQAAEAGLIDAELDMWSPGSTRSSVFDGKTMVSFPTANCGTSGNAIGLCANGAIAPTGKPAWLTVDFTATGDRAPTTEFGTFSGRAFAAGGAGVQPAKVPRYIIEPIVSTTGDMANPDQEVVYRVTAMGFGPRSDIQAIVQMIFRI